MKKEPPLVSPVPLEDNAVGIGFKGERGVIQGDPLSPTIFNVVVDVVVRHWVTLAVEEAETRG